jgi:hypothetical protein
VRGKASRAQIISPKTATTSGAIDFMQRHLEIPVYKPLHQSVVKRLPSTSSGADTGCAYNDCHLRHGFCSPSIHSNPSIPSLESMLMHRFPGCLCIRTLCGARRRIRVSMTPLVFALKCCGCRFGCSESSHRHQPRRIPWSASEATSNSSRAESHKTKYLYGVVDNCYLLAPHFLAVDQI